MAEKTVKTAKLIEVIQTVSVDGKEGEDAKLIVRYWTKNGRLIGEIEAHGNERVLREEVRFLNYPKDDLNNKRDDD